jgi:hypothetical protein
MLALEMDPVVLECVVLECMAPRGRRRVLTAVGGDMPLRRVVERNRSLPGVARGLQSEELLLLLSLSSWPDPWAEW